MDSVFKNIKVVEIASVLAGPAVGMFFAEKGASVIKIENKKTKGDVTRSWKLPNEQKDSPISAYFSSVNYQKSYLYLDLSDPKDRIAVENHIKEADILISNFKYGDAKKFRLDFEDVRQLNPRIIHAELSGFGTDDQRVAYDLVLQAETGFMSMNGTKESGPVKMPLAMIDILAAHQLKEGILEAMLMQNKSPKAYHVETSLYDAAIGSLYNQGANYLMADHIPQRIGSLHPNIAPYGEFFTCKDEALVTLAVGSDKQFNQLLLTLGVDADPRFESNKDRVSHRKTLAAILQNEIGKWSADELCETLTAKDVPIARINDLKAVFSNPKAKDLILEEEIDGRPTKRLKTVVYKITSA